MRKKLVLVATLALCLTVITTIVAMAPTLASPDSNANVNFYYSEGTVTLRLPPNGTNHPINLAIAAANGDRRSTFGAFDLLSISLWIPQAESYIPVAIISDNAQHLEFSKTFWNGTPIWRPPYLQGAISVADNDLDIWTESTRMNKGFGQNGGWNVESDDTFIVNLTKPVYISLPFNSQPSGSSRLWGNLSFTLPPFTLIFREIGDSYYIENSGGPSFSGITYITKGWQTPAWVGVRIPSWIHVGSLTEVGSTGSHMSDQFTLPP
jgi:hypothetical protein